MNWNKSNNDNNPWGSGGGNNPWGGGNSNNNVDFEDSIKKARERFGKFKIGDVKKKLKNEGLPARI